MTCYFVAVVDMMSQRGVHQGRQNMKTTTTTTTTWNGWRAKMQQKTHGRNNKQVKQKKILDKLELDGRNYPKRNY